MRYILKETFLDYLDQNGTKDMYFKELEEQARELLDECGELQLVEAVDLQKINKQFRVDINVRRVMVLGWNYRIKIRLGPVEELSLDEFVECFVDTHPESMEAYNQMIALMV